MTAKDIHSIRNMLQVVCQLPDYLSTLPPEEWNAEFVQKQAKHADGVINEYVETLKVTE